MSSYSSSNLSSGTTTRAVPAYAAIGGAKTTQPVLTPVRKAATTAPVRLSPIAPAAPAAPAATPQPSGIKTLKPSSPLPTVTPAAAPGAANFTLRPRATVAAVQPTAATPEQPQTAAPAAATPATDVVRPKGDQRALYYQLMNGLYDALLILDERGHVVDCSERVTKVLGYTREDAWDLAIDSVIPGMSNQMFEHLRRNLSDNQHILLDARCNRKDGTSFAAEVGVSTISLTRGTNIVFSVRNVERRKLAMDELRRGQTAMEVSLAPTFVCNLDGFFVAVNQSFLDAFGIPDADSATRVRFTDLLASAGQHFLRTATGEDVRELLTIPVEGSAPLRIELALKPVRSGKNVTAVAGSMLQL